MEQPAHDLKPFQSTTTQSTERRAISVGVVAVIHAIAIYALATGLASQFAHKAVDLIEAKVVQEKPPEIPKTPPPPPPEMTKPPPPFVPPPDINLQQTQTAPTITQVTTAITPPPPPAPPKPQPAPVTAPELAAGKATKCASSYYPPLAVRLNHQGSTLVTVHIAADGSVTGADVAQSSGFDELDQAAVKCVNNAWSFKPAEQGGRPVPSTKQYRIVWRLAG